MNDQKTAGSEKAGRLARLSTAANTGWNRVETAWDRGVAAVASSRPGRWFTGAERPNLVDWLLLGIILVLATVTFLYGDVLVTFEHSLNFLDAVIQGRPQDFYQIALENASFGHPAVYDVPVYLVFALWNLPSYLIGNLMGVDLLDSLGALMWLKLMLVAFAILAAWLMARIARTLGVNAGRAKWVAFYFLSSMTVFVPVFVIVQYDIVNVVVMLLGIHAYMRGRVKSFVAWFLVANTLKLFAIFIFVPLVLLREKRLPRAFVQIGVGLLGLLAFRLLYRGDLAYEISTGGFTEDMIARLHSAGFAWTGAVSVPIFVMIMVGLVIFAYAKRVTSERELQAFAIYIPLVAFLAFCCFVPLNPYWAVLVAPFAILIIFANPRYLTLNTLLETSIGSAIFLIYMLVGFSMYNAGMFNRLLFGRLIPPASEQRFAAPRDILAGLGLADYAVFLVGFLVACAIAVLVVNYPRPSFVAEMPNTEAVKRSVVWVRLAALVAFMGLLFAMYLVPARSNAYSSVGPNLVNSQVDIVADGSSVSEEVRFETSIVADAILIGFDAGAVNWIDSSTVSLTITDSSGAVVGTQTLASNALKVGLAKFDTAGLVFAAGETYTLTVSGEGSEGNPVYVQLNPDRDEFVTTENGRVVVGDVVMVIAGTVQS